MPALTSDAIAELEKTVIGCAIIKPEIVDDTIGRLMPDHFSRRMHISAWSAIIKLHSKSSVDIVTVKSEMVNDRLNEVEVVAFLVDCCERSIYAPNISYYIDKVLASSDERKAIEYAKLIISSAQDGRAAEEMRIGYDRMIASDAGSECVGIENVIGKAIDRIHNPIPVDKLGLKRFDSIFGGFRPGELTYCIARPAIGKSAFGVYLAWSLAQQGIPVSIFSSEMSLIEYGNRMLALVSGIDCAKLVDPFELSPLEKEQVEDAAKSEFSGVPITLYDKSGMSALDIRREAVKLKRRNGIKMLLIDHFHLLSHPWKEQVRLARINETSTRLAWLAKELQIHIFCFAHTNRAAEDFTPKMSDIKEAGAAEGDAANVCAITMTPPEMIEKRGWETAENISIIKSDLMKSPHRRFTVLKNRHFGKVGYCDLRMHGATFMFEEEEGLYEFGRQERNQGSAVGRADQQKSFCAMS